MREIRQVRRALGVTVILGLVFALMLVVVSAPPALGQVSYEEEFSFPEEAIRSFDAEVVVVDELLPAEVLGLRCTVSLTTHNSDSIHDTDLVVRSNGDSVVILDIEPGANVDKTAAGTLTLGTSITGVLVRRDTQPSTGKFVSSVGGTITVQCQESPSTTTTTIPEATTTTQPTGESSTTTTPPTTTPESTTSSSSSVPTSTTTPAPTTTAPTGSSTAPSTTPDTLPFTGVDSGGVGIMALVALVVGVTLAALTRKSKESADF